MENIQIPTIGRSVHYVNLGDKDGKYPPEIQLAFVTGVYKSTDNGVATANGIDDVPNMMTADLKVQYRTGEFAMQQVPYSEEYQRGHWSWMPYQKQQQTKSK